MASAALASAAILKLSLVDVAVAVEAAVEVQAAVALGKGSLRGVTFRARRVLVVAVLGSAGLAIEGPRAVSLLVALPALAVMAVSVAWHAFAAMQARISGTHRPHPVSQLAGTGCLGTEVSEEGAGLPGLRG